ncbi:hypothetical protein GcC1_065029 [Golovinomyces cichoracearum]|uniref:Uncharacterized protein n=1 Tax=Golovinomyces cichoracearum TaxID=62708 RepID=A0A420IRV1_9PEZI|nr:hypothetical protein GcC1_065029 [Golovinomyces cichoracearum]
MFMEYSPLKAFFEVAWERIQAQFVTQRDIITYLKTRYYVDEDGVNRSKWAAELSLDNENQGFRTTSSIEAMHRLIKTYLDYGFGHLFRLYQCVNEAIRVTSRKYQDELGEQKMAV